MSQRLAIVASHPVQYYAPLFRVLATQVGLTVFYGHRTTARDQGAGFNTAFEWDIDLLSGYEHRFMTNVAASGRFGSFGGIDTPEVGSLLRQGGFDAVLLMGWYVKSFLQALWACKRAGLPVMVRGDSQLQTPRSPWKRLGKQLLYPSFLRRFDAALVVGERNQAYWQHYGYPSQRMFRSPHCVDTEWFGARATAQARQAIRAQCGITASAPVALFAGKLVPFKRPLDVVEAAAKVRQRGLPLEVLVAGAGPLEADLRSLAGALKVPLHLLGFCYQSMMPEAYAAADVLVLPSTGRETWGLVANEALACARPIVLSDAVGCASDLAGDGTTGRIFPMGDTDALGKAVEAVMREAPGTDALRARSEAFSMQAAANGICQALQAIAPARKRMAAA